jgi:hypothetical protein
MKDWVSDFFEKIASKLVLSMSTAHQSCGVLEDGSYKTKWGHFPYLAFFYLWPIEEEEKTSFAIYSNLHFENQLRYIHYLVYKFQYTPSRVRRIQNFFYIVCLVLAITSP